MSVDPLADLLLEPPFGIASESPAFVPAVAECRAVLCQRFPRYADFLARPMSRPEELPALFLPILKSFQFPVPDGVSIVVRLTSSGTTGRPSETPLDEPNWRRRVAAMRASYLALDLFPAGLHVLAFLMDPTTTRMAGSVVIDAALRDMPQVRSLTYLAKLGPTGPQFSAAEAGAALARATADGPVLLVGYPALMAAALQGLAQAGRPRWPLPPGSCILTGGGWKSFLPGVSLDQSDFRAQAAAFFGLPTSAIRDMFGLSECPAVFVQCEQGRYHVPVWALAQAIDPETGQDMPTGEVGLLQLTVPLTTSYPLLKILTTDKALMQTGCSCGRRAPSLVPCGRVTAARFETCAMKIGKAVTAGVTS